ncbi:vacuolar membrane-associated protein iml1, partial [Coemansia sp. BCRC 34301]
MPPANPAPGTRSHVSIFDRRGQRPGRGRQQTGSASNANQSSSHRGSGSGSGNQSTQGDDASQGAGTLFNKTCMLRVHEDTFSSSDLVLNPSFFPGIRVGDVVAIKPIPDGDDGSGDVASPKGSLDTESGVGGNHSSEAPSISKGKGVAPPPSKSSTTPISSGPVTDTGELSADSKSGPGRATDRGGRRGAAVEAGNTPRHARCTGQPFGSLNPSMLNRLRELGEGNAELMRDIERADNDHNEGILKPDAHREILLKVGEVRRDTQQLQASVINHVARTLWGEYQANQRVSIRKIDMSNAEEYEYARADFVEIAFRDQYVGRSDMWRLWRNLSQKIVHNNKPTNMEGLIRASVRRIYKDGCQIPCGYIDSQTQPIFRSESGRFIIFIQMSEEMWAYQEDGTLCFEKAANYFMAELFRRWNEKQLNHMVTIVMFSRWFYSARDCLFFPDLILDEDSGRYYRDYYKVIADMEVRPDWSVFLPDILAEFSSYRRDIQEISTSRGRRLRGDLSRASEGNILEAINLGINSFASHHVDRDLARTGLSTIVVTPSFGVFDVPKPLLRMTTERMLHYGMRADFVCLAPMPLFRPPVFRFKAPIVPSEQDQQRALSLRQKYRLIEKRARETELNSVSPLDEGPAGFISPVASIPTQALSKDRGKTASVPSNTEAYDVVDPILLDPLYFKDDNWEHSLLPFLNNTLPKHSAGDDGTKASTTLGSAEKSPESLPPDSIVGMLLSNLDDVSDIPKSVLELSTADYPAFARTKTEPTGKDRRVIYCYFPYWVDCGFYNYFDDQAATKCAGSFRPSCKMGDLSVTGHASYMRRAPLVPDLDLRGIDRDLATAPRLDAQSAPAVDRMADEWLKPRDVDTHSIDAQYYSATRDVGHGRILQLGRKPATVYSCERLLDVFAEFDRQAIVGLGAGRDAAAGSIPAGSQATGAADSTVGGMSQATLPVYAGGTSEHRLQLSSANAASQQSIVLPSNASAHWEEQQQSHHSRHSDGRVATDRVEVGSAGSVEVVDYLTAAISTSASPNLGHGQHIKPPPRVEHSASASSSVPRDANVGGASVAVPQRSSIFVRNNSQRKRPQQHVKMQSVSGSIEPVADHPAPPAPPQVGQRRAAPGYGASPERALYSTASGRQNLHRVAESPQSIARGQYIQHNHGRLSGDMSIVTPSEHRVQVAESISKQSQLEEIRTFRGLDSHEAIVSMPRHQQQTPPGMAMPTGVAAHRHSTHPGVLLSEPDFQLTLPNGRQAAGGLPYSATAPSQPSAPADYHSGSPQYGKGLLLGDRLLLGHSIPDASPKGQRGRHYSPYDPCNPGQHQPSHTELSRLWAFALPTYSSLSSFTPKWRSLCTPASLPLVTDYFPANLEDLYTLFDYTVQTPGTGLEEAVDLPADDYEEFSQFMTCGTPASVSHSFLQMSVVQRTDRSTRIMLKEMVYQRLAQGFQFIKLADKSLPRNAHGSGVGKRGPLFKLNGRSDVTDRLAVRSGGTVAGAGAVEPFMAISSPHSSILPSGGSSQKMGYSVWMSNGRQIQKLAFQDSNGSSHMPGVCVTRWERKKRFDETPLRYKFHMWPRNNNLGYCSACIQFSFPRDDEVNWNSHDGLIVGYQTSSNKSTRYWRARYILVPSDHLGSETIVNAKSNPYMSVEDVRIANFEKFLDHVLRLLRKDEKVKLEERFLGALPTEIRHSFRPAVSAASSTGNGQSVLGYASKKLLGLSDLIPSVLMQIRYTTMYPVPYLSYQLYCHIYDKLFLDPTKPIALPQPAVTAMGLLGPLNVESPYSQLACALQHPEAGLQLRNLRWHYAHYRSIFAGYQLVDWMLVNFDGVSKRASAVHYGNRLMERGLFHSVQRAGPFVDGYHFYAFTDAAVECKKQSTQQHQHQHQQQPGRGQGSIMSSIGLADMVNRYGPSSGNPSPSASRPGSRQGSNAPSMYNYDDTGTSGAVSSNTGPGTGAKKNVSLAATSSTSAGPATKSVRDVAAAAAESSSDSRSIGAQPASKLRVRTDVDSQQYQHHLSKHATEATDTGDDSATTSVSHRPDFGGLSQQKAEQERANTSGSTRSVSNMARAFGPEPPAGISASDCHTTPDVYPEISRRRTLRPLPKQLAQSRMFTLDLDQQRKSTRVENCLVHLDAVQNPMTCFHLSINWLNCTNHLIDEMVHGWSRMAERCGMRLVEAPRAQDMTIQDNHPFHSPISINLLNAPPPVESIFDEEWIRECSSFGDFDSEAESSSNPGIDATGYRDSVDDGSSNERDDSEALTIKKAESDLASMGRKARIVRRMAKCLPEYAFERELLEGQDFILDVEAEHNYPDSTMLQRDYTFERQGHRYTQYVHRSGTAFVQICGPGQFL